MRFFSKRSMSRGLEMSRVADFVSFDFYRPCFYEDAVNTEFYGTVAPSENIWKKFELLPTPPRSPRRDEDDQNVDEYTVNTESVVSGHIGSEIENTVLYAMGDDAEGACAACSNHDGTCEQPKAKLIQDCMWSGCDESEPKNVAVSSSSTGGSKTTVTRPASLPCLDISETTACVDPTCIFPYPLSDTRADRAHSLGTDTPSDSEEEVDVVTIEKRRSSKNNVPMTTILGPIKSAPSAALPTSKANRMQAGITSIKTIRIPRAAKRSMSMPASPQGKRVKHIATGSNVPEMAMVRLQAMGHHDYTSPYKRITVARPSPTTSQYSSDSEEGSCEAIGGKRKAHNVLERKRRNDLKYSFVLLRGIVPELQRNEKAAKVVILKKAAHYICALNKEDKAMERELCAENARKEELERHLDYLQRTNIFI